MPPQAVRRASKMRETDRMSPAESVTGLADHFASNSSSVIHDSRFFLHSPI